MSWNGTDRQRPEPLEWLFKNCDDTGIDKRSWHTKQIVAELIEPGCKTIYCEILELIINSIWNRENSLNSRKS
jgi:hypothetical protein